MVWFVPRIEGSRRLVGGATGYPSRVVGSPLSPGTLESGGRDDDSFRGPKTWKAFEYGGNPEIGGGDCSARESASVDATVRRLAQGIFFALSIALILLAAGLEFAQRPVGLAFLVLWIALAVATAAFRQPGTRSAYDRGQLPYLALLGVFAFLALLVVGPWEYTHLSGPLPRDGGLAWAGIALFAVGVGINAWAMATLRGLYTVRLSVQEGHRLVTAGPYRIVRHPGYFGFLLILPGMGLALGSLAILAFVVPIVAWLVVRIRTEEAMLVTEFGEAYRSYQRRTKRLIPFLY